MSIADQITQLKQDIDEVYEAGYKIGLEDGKAQGNSDELIAIFTTALQKKSASGNNRTASSYNFAFYESTIDDDTMSKVMDNWDTSYTVSQAIGMFQNTRNVSEALYTDKLDFSNCNSLVSAFQYSTVKKVKVIDARKTTSGQNGMAAMFVSCEYLESIDEFYPSTGTNKTGFNQTFSFCPLLKTVIFKSEIAQNGLDLSRSPLLDRYSLKSIINNLSSTTTGLSVTLSLTAVNKAYETSEGANDGSTSETWLFMTSAKTNWTINLV